MDCGSAREAISAMLDGEDPGADSGELDQHLAGCAVCRAWRDAAHEVTRRVRLAPAQPAPRRTIEVSAAVRADRRRRWRVRPMALYRLGLVAVAAAQLAVAAPSLLLGDDRSAPIHIAHELGSVDAALAIGLLVAAWRPGRALGMRALVGAAAALLVTTAVIDMTAGRTTLADEAPHLLAVAGWLMIRSLAKLTPPALEKPRPRPVEAVRARLLARAWRGERLPSPPASPAALAAKAPNLVTASGLSADLGQVITLCGCQTGHCGCPGCAAPRQVAGG